MTRLACITIALVLPACSSSSSGAADGPRGAVADAVATKVDGATPQPDATAGNADAAPGSADAAPGLPDAAPILADAAPSHPDATAAVYTLTINNFDSWCTVTENGAPYGATMTFPAGTVVPLSAVPESSVFVWGYWTGTDAAGGGTAHDTSQSATVTMTSDRQVLACCPFKPPASQTCP